MQWLSKLMPESRKLIVMILSVVAYVVNALTGKHLDDEAMWTILGIVGTWMLAQGLSDHGSQGLAIAAARAKGKSPIAAAVAAGISVDQPQWQDTAAQDVADQVAAEGPKQLNG